MDLRPLIYYILNLIIDNFDIDPDDIDIRKYYNGFLIRWSDGYERIRIHVFYSLRTNYTLNMEYSGFPQILKKFLTYNEVRYYIHEFIQYHSNYHPKFNF